MTSIHVPSDFRQQALELLAQDMAALATEEEIFEPLQELYLNQDIQELYQKVLPVSRRNKIMRVHLSAVHRARLGADLLHPPSMTPDPYYIQRLVFILPDLLPRVYKLELEVPSEFWHLLGSTFGHEHDGVEQLQSLDLARVNLSGKLDIQVPEAHTVEALNWSLCHARFAWNLKSLRLQSCTLNLASGTLALQNLQELTFINLPRVASLTPLEVLNILRCFPSLKSLTVAWATISPPVGVFHFVCPGSVTHLTLELLSLIAEDEHCSLIFQAVKLSPACIVRLMVTDKPESQLDGALNLPSFLSH